MCRNVRVPDAGQALWGRGGDRRGIHRAGRLCSPSLVRRHTTMRRAGVGDVSWHRTALDVTECEVRPSRIVAYLAGRLARLTGRHYQVSGTAHRAPVTRSPARRTADRQTDARCQLALRPVPRAFSTARQSRLSVVRPAISI